MAKRLNLPEVVPPERFGRRGAERVAAAARDALAARGRFRLALPGGRGPRPLLHELVGGPAGCAFPWGETTVFTTDERAVPPGDPDRNDAMLRTLLLEPLGADAPRLESMWDGTAPLAEAAERYALLVAEPVDLLVLGLGEDAHVASLFPDSPLLGETRARVGIVHDSPKPPPTRLTFTPRVFAEAGQVLVLAAGEAKAAAVAATFADLGAVRVTPARLLRDAAWLVDEPAAAWLSGGR